MLTIESQAKALEKFDVSSDLLFFYGKIHSLSLPSY